MGRKSDSEILYKTYNKNMCLAPFLNTFYLTCGVGSSDPHKKISNQAMPCSIIKKSPQWEILDSSIMTSRNNTVWKDLRQSFLDGKLHELCTTCINAEALGSSSPRQLNNEYMFEHLDIDIMHEIKKIVDADLHAEQIFALDYMPSNYCNYACIMCSGGASSARLTFEIQQGAKIKYQINPVDKDFPELIKNVKILGFTGGETIMQPEVINLIDYTIENKLASNMIITILTNASSFPDGLIEKFKHFRRVLYTVSVDGVGDVIEYQRRGCKFPEFERNVLKIKNTDSVHEIINNVVTAVNILNAMDFVDWCASNELKFIVVSNVFQDYLGVNAMPPELVALALQRLQDGRRRYAHLADSHIDFKPTWLATIDRLISVLEQAKFSQSLLDKFISHIKKEDAVSKKSLHEIVPEWAPWFTN